MSARPAILDRIAALADPIRCRLLLVLERHELSVGDLCAVMQLPQSTVSRHLKVLGADGWTASRRDGTSRRYALAEPLETSARRLWALVREEVAGGLAAAQDRRRLEGVLAERRSRSQEFFSSTAGQWAQVRRELFGPRFDLFGLLGLLDSGWAVADLGCGSGEVAGHLAAFVGNVVAVDDSAAMLEAARARLGGLDNVDVRQGSLEALPLADSEVDVATLVLVLHHLPEPARALAEAARVLRPGGKLLVLDMLPHDREDYRQAMGHVWLGFGREQLERWLGEAGFEGLRLSPLPADPEARGPTLFAATAARREAAAGSVRELRQVSKQQTRTKQTATN